MLKQQIRVTFINNYISIITLKVFLVAKPCDKGERMEMKFILC